jgi:hypothetical protein
MNVFDLYHDCKVEAALTSQTIATETNTDGEIIDTAGFEALTFAFLSGTITDGDYEVQLFHGDESDLSDATAVDADEVLGSVVYALAEDETAKRIGYIGKKRYVRPRVVSTNTTSGGLFAAIALLSTAHHGPVDNQ